MDKHRAQRITESYALVAPSVDRIAEHFYATLFKDHPALRAIFPADMTRQRQHLATAIALTARNVDRIAALEQPLREMGARHQRYGALPGHYPVVCDLLIGAIAHVAGPAWNAQLEADWRELLGAVSAAMLRGAAEEAQVIARELEETRIGPRN